MSYVPIKSRAHKWEITCDICLSETDLIQLSPDSSIFLKMTQFYILLLKQSSVYVNNNFFIHSSVNGCLSWCHSLSVVKSDAVNWLICNQLQIDVQGSQYYVDLASFGYKPRSGITGTYGIISRNLYIDFCSGWRLVYISSTKEMISLLST